MSRNKNESIRATLLVASATLAGLTIGVLFAPQAGQKTRRDVRRVGSNLAERVEEVSEDLRERVEELTSCAASLADQSMDKGKEIRKRLKGTLEASRDSITRQIHQLEKLVKG